MLFRQCMHVLLTTSWRSSAGARYRTSTFCPACLCSRMQCKPGSSCFICLHKRPFNVQQSAWTQCSIFHGPVLSWAAAVQQRCKLFTNFSRGRETQRCIAQAIARMLGVHVSMFVQSFTGSSTKSETKQLLHSATSNTAAEASEVVTQL